ncbi:MAG TPA: CHAD domain-containing protein [Longimicrobium sp.]|jgi:CHAD domain-containing protein/CYTH domain-containing protein|uniref:CHAD domain-containing protein n=1 Tax=Longimicrobium sp. TaxID=2029185 RepID=UPI002ED9B993
MKGAAVLLELSAPRAARWLALRFLHEADEARARLDDPGDSEALHDFRVAIRRLRSTLRAYAEHVDESIGGRDRRRLRKLAHATGDSRDGEVLIQWVQSRREGVPSAGPDWLDRRLRKRQAKLGTALRDEVAHDFARERRRLQDRLEHYTSHVDAADPRELPRMSLVLADLVERHAAELRERLAEVRSVDMQEVAHEGRIAAKRLRYLIEPFGGELSGASALVKRIKALQETLGQMHDAHVAAGVIADALGDLEEDDDEPRDGLAALAGIAQAEVQARYAEVEAEWLGDGAEPFFAGVAELVARLRSGGENREIERKYLLRGMPVLPEGAVRTDIVQGYVPGERLNERVRRVRREGTTKFYRTIKMGSGLSRMELEEETTELIFRRLWSLTRGRRVQKVRYRVRDGDFTWEIDRFRDRSLFLAEIELPSEDTEVALPDWLRDCVERDVTGEPEYVNLNLAR